MRPPAEADIIEPHPSLLSKLSGLFLVTFGSLILVWISSLTWYDFTTWGKDLALIFLGSRAGEPIDLRIGMRVIHSFIIGLILLLTETVIYLRRRKSST